MPASVCRVGLPEARACPRGPDAAYQLIYNDPEDPDTEYPLGWTLTAWRGRDRCWSAALAAHGAGALTGPRLAKAVVVRALCDRGVAVRGWDLDTSAPQPTYRAGLH
jgi:hypothetical protein